MVYDMIENFRFVMKSVDENNNSLRTQQTHACSKIISETLEKDVK